MKYLGVIVPAISTLQKYGLSLREWKVMLRGQGGVCAVCGRVPPSGRLVVDHEHVPGWKQMPPPVRKTFVRGLLCNHCNHRVLGWYLTLEKAEAAVLYLRAYQEMKQDADSD